MNNFSCMQICLKNKSEYPYFLGVPSEKNSSIEVIYSSYNIIIIIYCYYYKLLLLFEKHYSKHFSPRII